MSESTSKRSKGSGFRVYVATSFPNSIFCEIESLAKEHQLCIAQIVRDLFLRGLVAYHRDGRLTEVAEQDRTLTVSAQEGTVEIAA